MNSTKPPAPPPLAAVRPDVTIGIVLVLICAPEMIVWAAEMGWVGSTLWRPLSVQNGAFWPGLLKDWRPNYPAQPWSMFLTYSVLHISPWHMLGNALALLWLGPQVIEHMGRTGFWLVWIASAVIGAISFALLSVGTTPMVGASGSVFGLIGAVVMQGYMQSGRIRTACAITGGLLVLHLIALVIQDGHLAWQPHLGGYVAGAFLAIWYTRRPPALP